MQPRYGQDIPYGEAIAMTRSNPGDKWPGRGDDCRLEPEAWPKVAPRFRLQAGQRIFTIGSCFARNIEEYLKVLDFDIPTLRMSTPGEALGGRPNAILNKYTPAAIAQEIEWTRRMLDRGGVLHWADIEPFMLETGPGMYLDMHLNTATPVSRERALERRAELLAINKDGFEGDVVVITPGVIEAWLDSQTGLYIQRPPLPNHVKRFGAERFRFRVLTYEECHAFLARAVDLLDPARRKRFLFTVSPVPLSRTFTDQDIVIANQYSKSLLRAVVGRIYAERENCDYFPSYETVMLTRQSYVWEDDLIHVSDSFVSKIVRRLVGDRLDGDSGRGRLPSVDLAAQFTDFVRREDDESALAAYREMGELAGDIAAPGFHKQATRLFFRARDFAAALRHAQKVVELQPGIWKPLYLLALAQHRAGDAARAQATAEKALALTRKKENRSVVERLIRNCQRNPGKTGAPAGGDAR